MSRRGTTVRVKLENGNLIMKRLISFIFENYKVHCIITLVFIFISSTASVLGSLFIKSLIDDYIVPMIGVENPDFMPLMQALLMMGTIYLIGVISTYVYNRILLTVAQGTLKKTRDMLFEHMEKLPISYFDTHAHGDIMSIYTNDTDTLQQMLSQSVPQMFSSIMTIVGVLISMITISIPLTLIVLVIVFVIKKVSSYIINNSSTYFVLQQKNIGKVNAYIEEMMQGQKVIKVFTHEDKAIEEFEGINEELFDSAYKANYYANIMMPIMGNLGYVNYVICAIIGGLLSIYTNSISIGGLGFLAT